VAEQAHRLGPLGFRASPSTAPPDWAALDSIWALAGELDVFDAGWLSDHLSDASLNQGGGAFETVAMAAALAHRVPGKWIGVAVFAATFRHPAVLAKSATVIDNASGGRFILGLGAGWHEGEHRSFGIPLPPPRERFDRLESYLLVLRALFSEDALSPPGVTLDDPFYPLDGATMEPAPTRRGGPSIWVGGIRQRGIELTARFADGWPMPGNRIGDVAHFIDRRDALLRALERAGRDPANFTFAAQVACGSTDGERRQALSVAREMRRAGADHLMLSIPAGAGSAGLRAMADEVARPMREEVDRQRTS
jgi:alkanesulfonate monooxygenase SsuD/methylene tetrahydromethanopterin reductase-like flavin-dependent oxidoreductase (luciferase family)